VLPRGSESPVGGELLRFLDIYSGEGFEEAFEEAEESFFGFMLREAEQQGRPFEPRTVRMKSELRGPGRVALPLAFCRAEDGSWHARWLHPYLKGRTSHNQIEGNRVSVATLLRGIVQREQLTVRYPTEPMAAGGTLVAPRDGGAVPEEGPVTYIGALSPSSHMTSRTPAARTGALTVPGPPSRC
jgi:hypothetical protein